jgi:phenylalanyl-tRNA synthetase alpha subunit
LSNQVRLFLILKYGGTMENIEDLKIKTLEQIEAACDIKALDEIRVAVLGKKGALTELMKGLGALSLEEKKQMGQTLNLVKVEIEKAFENKKENLAAKELNERLAKETIDVTLPIRDENIGRIHPVSKIYEEVVAIFGEMGFEVADNLPTYSDPLSIIILYPSFIADIQAHPLMFFLNDNTADTAKPPQE